MNCFNQVTNRLDLDTAAISIGFQTVGGLSDYCVLLLGYTWRMDNI